MFVLAVVVCVVVVVGLVVVVVTLTVVVDWFVVVTAELVDVAEEVAVFELVDETVDIIEEVPVFVLLAELVDASWVDGRERYYYALLDTANADPAVQFTSYQDYLDSADVINEVIHL